ncbi:V-type ATP synthase subunit A, partial [Barnesiella sp. GGCC_0306]|nr:V-type ATP synthase subunit A [Barnesiella sp. GGCC_0306]
EDEVRSILMLVGKDALSDAQRNILDVSELIRVGFLQQNAYNDTDKYVPLEKQIEMLNVIRNYYHKSAEAIENGVP